MLGLTSQLLHRTPWFNKETMATPTGRGDTVLSVRGQITRLWSEPSRVSISTLSQAAVLVYLPSACDCK